MDSWEYFKRGEGAIAPPPWIRISGINFMWDTYFKLFQCVSFYNEIKLRVAVNTELNFLSGPYLVKNQMKHKHNFQNTDRC
jgi:hypothetical protein